MDRFKNIKKEFEIFSRYIVKHNSSNLIHVGASEGQERDIYDMLDLEVLWVEPQLDIFEKLKSNLRGYKKQKAVNDLLTNVYDKEYDFYVASNSGQSSSILEFGDHKRIWPGIRVVRTEKITSTTLDRVVNKVKYDAMVLDTQGSELLVLKGGTEVLKNTNVLMTEATTIEGYKNNAMLHEIEDYLKSFGFTKKEQIRQSKSYYDVIFTK